MHTQLQGCGGVGGSSAQHRCHSLLYHSPRVENPCPRGMPCTGHLKLWSTQPDSSRTADWREQSLREHSWR
eukprot:5499163-Prymnesium_polylepis.1